MAKRATDVVFGTALTFAAALGVAAPTAAAPDADQDAVIQLVDAFTRAQREYDQPRLAALTTPDYVEVSPVGDVDTREEMLSFYAPERKRPAPELVISERLVRRHGNDAVVLAKLSFGAPGPGGAVRTVAMRAGFVARRQGRDWRLAAAHYTPMRSPGS